ncbi:hypothetical protein [Nocardia sputi]|uniref:hypothetical protein n=1 Tax=Nocardia sputi TaxID=2943705 RepID=UPI0020BD7AA1|nr:hypothetical protein [Nocardia sputi]
MKRRSLLALITGMLCAATLAACSGPDPGPVTAPPTSEVQSPSGLRWEIFHGVDLPIADQGPDRIDGAAAAGFDRNPAGAALAAIHASVRMTLATDTQWPRVGQQMLAPGSGRDAWATTRAQISITAPITEGPPKILGYRINGYTDTAADVQIYAIHPDNSATRHSTRVVWHTGDWRLEVPHNPTESPVTAITAPPHDLTTLTPRR